MKIINHSPPTLEKLVDMIEYLTINFGKNHPESFIPEQVMFDNDGVVYNCSFGKFVYDIGFVRHCPNVHGIAKVRLITTIEVEGYSTEVYEGNHLGSPKPYKLVFSQEENNKYGEDIFPEVTKWEWGDWEYLILKEYESKTLPISA